MNRTMEYYQVRLDKLMKAETMNQNLIRKVKREMRKLAGKEQENA